MATLSDVMEDLSRVKEIVNSLYEKHGYEFGAPFGEAVEPADEAARLLTQVASDFEALDSALISTRPE